MGFKTNGGLCDICNKSLKLKIHAACSRKRQAMHANEARPKKAPKRQRATSMEFLAKVID